MAVVARVVVTARVLTVGAVNVAGMVVGNGVAASVAGVGLWPFAVHGDRVGRKRRGG